MSKTVKRAAGPREDASYYALSLRHKMHCGQERWKLMPVENQHSQSDNMPAETTAAA